MANIVVDNILAILDGKQPPNCVIRKFFRLERAARLRDGP